MTSKTQRTFFLWVSQIIVMSLLVFEVSVKPVFADSTITQTSYQDFTQNGPVLDNTAVRLTGASDGSIVLSPAFSDDFPGSALDLTNWNSYLWANPSQTYTPTVINSTVTIPGSTHAYVASNAAYPAPTGTNISSIQFVGTFNPGSTTYSQFVGVANGVPAGAPSFYQYILFGTYIAGGTFTAGDLYARIDNNGTEVNQDLGAIPDPSTPHAYRINWYLDPNDALTNIADFYIDNVQVAELSVTGSATALPDLYAYISNDSDADLSVDSIQVAPDYLASGTYTSAVLDAGAGNLFRTMAWTSALPTGTSATFETRSSQDNLTWSNYASMTSGGAIPGVGRYVQYQATLTTSDATITPEIQDVSLTYGAEVTDLSIGKTGPSSVIAGDDFTYTISVNNHGPDPATSSITVNDTLPPGTTYVSATGSGWICNNVSGTVTCTRTGLAYNASSDITLTLQAPADPATLSNSASVSIATDPNSGNDTSDSVQTTVQANADLTIAKGGPASVNAGANIPYTLTVTNQGPSVATGTITVTDVLPSGTSFVNGTGTGWNCGDTSGTVTCTNPNGLAVDDSSEITLTVTAPVVGGDLLNSATVSIATDLNSANNTSDTVTTTVVPVADLALQMTGPHQIVQGQTVMYTISVSNLGPSQASAVEVTDTLPTGATLVSAAGSGWSCSGTTTIQCQVSSLAVGAAPDIQISVTAPMQFGTLDNQASVAATTQDGDLANNSQQVSTVLLGHIWLPSVSK